MWSNVRIFSLNSFNGLLDWHLLRLDPNSSFIEPLFMDRSNREDDKAACFYTSMLFFGKCVKFFC